MSAITAATMGATSAGVAMPTPWTGLRDGFGYCCHNGYVD